MERKKSLFYDWTTKKLSLKISEQVKDRLKIIIGGEYLAFHLSAEEKSDPLENWLTWNRLVEIGQLLQKEISETILMNRNNSIYSSKQYANILVSFNGSQNLFLTELTNFNQSVPIQPVLQ